MTNLVIAKATSKLKFIYRNWNILNTRLRKSISVALMQYHLDYCDTAWYSSLSSKLKAPLQTTGKKNTFFYNRSKKSRRSYSVINKHGLAWCNGWVCGNTLSVLEHFRHWSFSWAFMIHHEKKNFFSFDVRNSYLSLDFFVWKFLMHGHVRVLLISPLLLSV